MNAWLAPAELSRREGGPLRVVDRQSIGVVPWGLDVRVWVPRLLWSCAAEESKPISTSGCNVLAHIPVIYVPAHFLVLQPRKTR